MESSEDKKIGAFRKLSNDAVHRKYRRRAGSSSSASSEGSPARKRSSSPIRSRKDDWRHKDDDLDRDSSRDRLRLSDRQSSRSSRSHHRLEEYNRHGRRTDDGRGYSKQSSHSHHDSRVNNYSDHPRRDNDHRSRDYPREIDKQYRDRYEDSGHRSKDRERETSSFKDKDSSLDRVGSGRRYNNSSIDDNISGERDRYKELRDNRDEKGDHRGDYMRGRSPAYEESRSSRYESHSRKDSSEQQLNNASHIDVLNSDGEKYTKEERKKYGDRVWYKEKSYHEETGGKFEDRNVASGKRQESPAKKSKFSGIDQNSEQGKDGSNPASLADGKLSSSSKQGHHPNSELALEALERGVKDSDIDAAKIAAMKAAELVNRNLIGTGIMTADQKKKLLWGNKKATTNTEESTHRWDTALFGDRERQEKFNKLMSLRLPWYLWPIVGCERRCEDREQARHPRCREAEGASDGLGEAIHRWTSPERWPYSWTRSLRFSLTHRCTCTTVAAFVLCCLALWELHVLFFTKCILKFPVPCDYGFQLKISLFALASFPCRHIFPVDILCEKLYLVPCLIDTNCVRLVYVSQVRSQILHLAPQISGHQFVKYKYNLTKL